MQPCCLWCISHCHVLRIHSPADGLSACSLPQHRHKNRTLGHRTETEALAWKHVSAADAKTLSLCLEETFWKCEQPQHLSVESLVPGLTLQTVRFGVCKLELRSSQFPLLCDQPGIQLRGPKSLKNLLKYCLQVLKTERSSA